MQQPSFNQNLMMIVQSVPNNNPQEILTSLIGLEKKTVDFDEFFWVFMGSLNYQYINPFNALVYLSKVNDGTEVMTTISTTSFQYFQTIFAAPNLFNEAYTIQMLQADVVRFISNNVDMEWFGKFLASFNEAMEDSLQVWPMVLYNLCAQSQAMSLIDSAKNHQLVYYILNSIPIRKAFASSEIFGKAIDSLFFQSVFNVVNKMQHEYYFGNEAPKSIKKDKIVLLGNSMKSYHERLGQIIRQLLKGETRAQTYKYLKTCMATLEANTTILTPDREFEIVTYRYNFMCVMLDLAFLQQQKWGSVYPLIPYLNESIVPLGEKETEIALVGGRPGWVEEDNLDQFYSFQGDEIIGYDIEKAEAEWNAILEQYKSQPADPMSTFFFIAAKCINVVIPPLMETITHLNHQIMSVKGQLKNPGIDQMSKMNAERTLNILEAWVCSIEVIVTIPHTKQRLLEFSSAVLDFLLQASNYNSLERTLDEYPPMIYQHIPEYFISGSTTVILWQYYERQINRLDLIITKLATLCSNHRYIRNPQIKAKIIKLFASIVTEPPGGNAHLMATNTVLDLFYPAVIRFYSSVQFTGSHSQFYDKMNFRHPCIRLLNLWLRFNECREHFRKTIDDEENQRFLFFLLDDTQHFVSDIVSNFLKIDPQQLKKMKKPKDKDEMKAHEDAIRDSKSEIKNCMSFLDEWRPLLVQILEFAWDAFKTEELRKKLALFIISTLENYFKYPIMQEFNSDDLGYNPNTFFVDFVELLVFFSNDETMIKYYTEFCNEGLRGNLIPVIEAKLVSISSGIRVEGLISKFQYFKMKENQVVPDASIFDGIDTSDAPDEFFDKITCELMSDPVTILLNPQDEPDPGYIIDRETLKRSFIEQGKKDPFRTVPVTDDQIVEVVELKQRILDWVKSKRDGKA